MSIKIKEVVRIGGNGEVSEEDLEIVENQIRNLLPGDYSVFVCDAKKNRTLPQLRYLFGVVLRMMSKDTGMEVNDLYRIFENKYAPKKVVQFQGEDQIVQDLKSVTSKEMGDIIERIIRFADVELNIKIPTQDELREPMAQEIYVDAYNQDWYTKEMKKRSK